MFDAAARAEAAVRADPRAACFYARRTLELAVAWAYEHDAALRLPYQDNLSALIHEPSFKCVLLPPHLVHRVAEVFGDVELIEGDLAVCSRDVVLDRSDVALPHVQGHGPDALELGGRVLPEVVEEVGHCLWTFTIPKMLRPGHPECTVSRFPHDGRNPPGNGSDPDNYSGGMTSIVSKGRVWRIRT